LPRERLGPFCLAQRLEEADALAIRIEAVDVVQDDGLMAVLVGLKVNAKRGSLASDPADLVPQPLTDGSAFADAGRAKDHEQV
jgi:hypothetical protein